MPTEQNQQRDQANRPIQKDENFAPGNRPEQQQHQKPAQGGFDKPARNPHDENRDETGQKEQRDRDANQGTRGEDKGMKR